MSTPVESASDGPCPFCEIVAGRASADLRVVDDHGIIFTPLNPVTPGHVLVVSHEHVEDFTTSPMVTAEVTALAADYAKAQGGDFNLIISKGEAATQSVMHLHVHLVPRTKGDDLPLPWTPQHEAQEDAEKVRMLSEAFGVPETMIDTERERAERRRFRAGLRRDSARHRLGIEGKRLEGFE